MRNYLLALGCLVILLLMWLVGGCSQVEQPSTISDRQDTTMTLRQLSWSRTGILAMTRHSNATGGNILLLTPPRDITNIGNDVWQTDGWNDNGDKLLIESSSSENRSDKNLLVYDEKTGQLNSVCLASNEQPLCACWSGNNTVTYAAIPKVQSQFSIKINVKTASGKLIASSDLPSGLMPAYISYVHQSDSLVIATASLVKKRYHYDLNVWKQGQLFPVEGTDDGTMLAASYNLPQLVMVTNSSRGFSGIKSLDFGSGQVLVTSILDASQFPAHTEITNMSFSPDSSQLAISIETKANSPHVYLYGFSSKKLTSIADGSMAAFSPDGRTVTYIASGSRRYLNSNEVYTTSLDGNNVHLLYGVPSNLPLILYVALGISFLVALGLWRRLSSKGKKQ